MRPVGLWSNSEWAMLKLWGRVNSINVQKVLWALEELAVPYERVEAGMAFGVVNEPFYKKMNPNSRVPTIEDDGFVLWESNAIVRYLAAKHGLGTLCPPTSSSAPTPTAGWTGPQTTSTRPLRRCSGGSSAPRPRRAT